MTSMDYDSQLEERRVERDRWLAENGQAWANMMYDFTLEMEERETQRTDSEQSLVSRLLNYFRK